MSLPRIHYHVVGEDDYMLVIDVQPDGSFVIDCGDYTSHEPTQGRISAAQRDRLTKALGTLGESAEHPAPDGATGFMAELTVGDGPTVRHYRFWEGSLDALPDLKALVRELTVLG